MPGPVEFSPYSLYAIRVPLGMLAYPGLSSGAKLLYGRLALFRGRQPNGFCKPRLDTLAQAMGTSMDTIDRWLGELAREGFIERRRHGRGVAECIFLAHPALVSGPISDAEKSPPNSAELRNQSEPSNSADLPPQFRKSAPSNSANLPQESPHPTDTSVGCATENIHQDVQDNVHQEKGDKKPPVDPHSDDEKKRLPGPRRDPQGDLREIYRRKTGVEIPRDLEWRLWDICEQRGVTRLEYIGALQEHLPNAWHNPAGFLTDFARKIHTKRSRPFEPVSAAAFTYSPDTGRCVICRGIGFLGDLAGDALSRQYCACPLGRDLERTEKGRAKAAAASDTPPAPAATPKPVDSSETSQSNDNLHSRRPRGKVS